MNEAGIRVVIREELAAQIPVLAEAVAAAMVQAERVRRAKEIEWRNSQTDPSRRYVSPRQRQSSQTLPEQ